MQRPSFLTALLCAALTLPAAAQSFDDVARGELLTGWRTGDGALIAALRITLEPGWKTYWRAPGDAGIPPRFNWSGSRNLASASVDWPVPDIFDQNGLRSVGYDGVVVLPLTLRPTDPGAGIDLRADVEIGVCEDICIPMTLRVAADLPPGPGRDHPEIRAAIADRPMTRAEAGVAAVSCEIQPIRDGMRVVTTVTMPKLGRDEVAVIELTGMPVWVSEPEVTRRGDTLRAVADVVPPEGAPFALPRDALRLTVIAGGRAADIKGCS